MEKQSKKHKRNQPNYYQQFFDRKDFKAKKGEKESISQAIETFVAKMLEFDNRKLTYIRRKPTVEDLLHEGSQKEEKQQSFLQQAWAKRLATSHHAKVGTAIKKVVKIDKTVKTTGTKLHGAVEKASKEQLEVLTSQERIEAAGKIHGESIDKRAQGPTAVETIQKIDAERVELNEPTIFTAIDVHFSETHSEPKGKRQRQQEKGAQQDAKASQRKEGRATSSHSKKLAPSFQPAVRLGTR